MNIPEAKVIEIGLEADLIPNAEKISRHFVLVALANMELGLASEEVTRIIAELI